jgi:hypothetical protein
MIKKGQVIMCTDRSCSVLGYKSTIDTYNDQIQLPTLNFKGAEILDFMTKNPSTTVTLHMESTGNCAYFAFLISDLNPWEDYGNGPAGKTYIVVMEILSFICLITSTWKMYAFVKFQSFSPNITQISLIIEIIVAISTYFVIRF